MNRTSKGINRRDVLKRLATGALGSALLGKMAKAETAKPARLKPINPLAATSPIWQLERPAKPALPNSYFWTWNHRTNWVWDDPGMLNFGCKNRYPKKA